MVDRLLLRNLHDGGVIEDNSVLLSLEPATPATRRAPFTGTAIDQVLGATPVWHGPVIYYQMPDSSVGFGYHEYVSGFVPMSEAVKAQFRIIFQELNHILGVRFEEWPSGQLPPNANLIRIATSTDEELDIFGAQASFPGIGFGGGVIWFDEAYVVNRAGGDHWYWNMRHEIGHSLGLGHPHESLGDSPGSVDAGTGWTAMSYFAFGSDPLQSTYHASIANFHSKPHTFMPLDILALQYLYGKNPFSNGDQTYRVTVDAQASTPRFGDFDPAPRAAITYDDGDSATQDIRHGGPSNLHMSTWDSGGNDTLSFEGVQRSLGEAGVEVRIFASLLEAYLGPQDPDFNHVRRADFAGPRIPAIRFLLDEQSWIENIVGSAHADIVSGEGALRALDVRLGGGNDILRGGRMDDRLDGGAGNDVLTGNAGADRLSGGAGEDVFRAGPGSGHDELLDFAPGADRLEIWGYAGAREMRTVGADTLVILSDTDSLLLRNVQAAALTTTNMVFGAAPPPHAPLDPFPLPAPRLGPPLPTQPLAGTDGTIFRDWIVGTDGGDVMAGHAGSDRLEGGAGNDIIYGHDGDDDLSGGEGNDYLAGGFTASGDDRLEGGPGNDRLEGGSGDDTFVFRRGDGADLVVDFYAGGTHDRIEVHGYDSFREIRQDGLDTVVVFSDTDSMHLGRLGSPLTADDFVFAATGRTIVGSDFADLITGGGHADRLAGGGGSDVIEGALGNDSISGGAENDILIGGLGNDVIDGGSGDDTAFYQGVVTSYRIFFFDDHVYIKGPDGGDRLTNVETIRFSGGGTIELNRLEAQSEKLLICTEELEVEPLVTPAEIFRPDVAPSVCWDGPDGFACRLTSAQAKDHAGGFSDWHFG